MHHPRDISPTVFCAALLTAPLMAQWGTIPQDPTATIYPGAFVVSHQNAQGIHAFSALAQTWTTVSPPGSTHLFTGDYYVVTQEAGGVLRGWSARRNASAVQAVSGNIQVNSGLGDVVVVVDNVPAGTPVLRAYSAVTNAWSSIPLNTLPTTPAGVTRTAAMYLDGTNYLGFSANTGQWTSLAVTTAGRSPQVHDNLFAIDLAGVAGLGPRQIAAFSGIRGNWALSPVYPGTGGASLTMAHNCAAARVALPNAAQVSHAGYSAIKGQWVTSTFVHNVASSPAVVATHNLVRVLDSNTATRYEMFGAGNGVWSQLTGTGLNEAAIHEDFVYVSNATGSILACSALVGGGWVQVTDPAGPLGAFGGTSKHAGMVLGTSGSGSMWGYSAATNAFVGPVPCPIGQGGTVGGGAVVGFNINGSAGAGTHAQALSARWNTWVAGPLMTPSIGYMTVGAGSVLVTYDTFPSNGYVLNVFDEHANRWQAPFQLPPSYGFTATENTIAAQRSAGGTVYLYSAQRGDWTSIPNVAPINGTGSINITENIAWFTAGGLLYAFGTPDTTHTWFEWPLGPDYATSGPAPTGNAVPFIGVSVKGIPAIELAVVYAALSLAPSPVPVPGVGNIDLNPSGVVLLANLGTFDADGLAELQIPVPAALLPGLQIWFQALKLNTVTLQPLLAGRAAATWLF